MKSWGHWIYSLPSLLFVTAAVVLFFVTKQDARDIPVWIQAVGSVLAIVAVFWISDANRKKEGQLRNQNILAVAAAAYEYAMSIKAELVKARDPFATKDTLAAYANMEYPLLPNGRLELTKIREVYHANICAAYAMALANISYHEAGSPKAVQALLSLQAQFASFLPKSMDSLLAGPGIKLLSNAVATKNHEEKHFEGLLNSLMSQFDFISSNFELIKNELKADLKHC